MALVVLAAAVLAVPFRGDDDREPPSGAVADGSPNATLTATARGVATDAPIEGITSLAVADPSSITIEGHMSGEDPAFRSFSVVDRAFTLSGREMTLDVRTTVRRNEVRIQEHRGIDQNVSVRGRVTLAAGEVTSRVRGKDDPVIYRGPVSFIADGSAKLRTGPGLEGTPVRWTDAPKTIRVRDAQRSTTTWAGRGTVRAAGRTMTDEFGGLAARELVATLERGPDAVKVSGRGRVQQVYLDGVPQFRTTASCDLVQIREETTAGRRLELTWAPRNTGRFDMVMTRIVPVGPAADWLSFGLAGGPNEFGGEERPYRRGDTRGFRQGSPIRALLPPGDADRRDIGVEVPRGTPEGTYDASVRIEGNFDAVVVPFEVIVVSAGDLDRR